jgi:hypothetical protein
MQIRRATVDDAFRIAAVSGLASGPSRQRLRPSARRRVEIGGKSLAEIRYETRLDR